jgi:rubrerythrin
MNSKELDIIKQAILNEIEGYEFYKMAAKQSGSKESEEAFNELANEELKPAD